MKQWVFENANFLGLNKALANVPPFRHCFQVVYFSVMYPAVVQNQTSSSIKIVVIFRPHFSPSPF